MYGWIYYSNRVPVFRDWKAGKNGIKVRQYEGRKKKILGRSEM